MTSVMRVQGARRKPQVSPLRYPGFPVEFGGVGNLHAAFLNESRTRGHVQALRGRKSGYAPVEMTNLLQRSHSFSAGKYGFTPQQICHLDRSVA
jgi:hypothetical protein